MTEQPDTATIRAGVARNQYAEPEDTLALCDALDAARAERDEWKANTLANEALYLKHFNRAEAAEARIAKALATLDDLGGVARKAEVFTALHHVRRALTEGTGQ